MKTSFRLVNSLVVLLLAGTALNTPAFAQFLDINAAPPSDLEQSNTPAVPPAAPVSEDTYASVSGKKVTVHEDCSDFIDKAVADKSFSNRAAVLAAFDDNIAGRQPEWLSEKLHREIDAQASQWIAAFLGRIDPKGELCSSDKGDRLHFVNTGLFCNSLQLSNGYNVQLKTDGKLNVWHNDERITTVLFTAAGCAYDIDGWDAMQMAEVRDSAAQKALEIHTAGIHGAR